MMIYASNLTDRHFGVDWTRISIEVQDGKFMTHRQPVKPHTSGWLCPAGTFQLDKATIKRGKCRSIKLLEIII